jgi:hypothetical protein
MGGSRLDEREDRRSPLNYADQVLDRDVRVGHRPGRCAGAEVPQHCYYRLTETSPCENGGERRDQILVPMTHRHFAIFRTRVKPYRAYNSSGPVCRKAPRCGGRSSVCSG